LDLPEHVRVTAEHLHAISGRHGLGASQFELLPSVGITNAIYRLGDRFVLRVPRKHPGFIATAFREIAAVPVARRLGVKTPELVALDDTRDILDVPYTIYERVEGETLGLLGREPSDTPDAYRALGRDLAKLHAGVTEADVERRQECDLNPGHWPSPERLAMEGYFTVVEARWFAAWFDRLASLAAVPIRPRFLHGDVQATNVLVRPGSLEYTAILDWGNAGWGDPALDWVGLPTRAVPLVLEGYRDVLPTDDDLTIEARILFYHLWFALETLARPPQPDLSWAERPMSMLLELLRFMLNAPGSRWRELAP
jgi:aminoglycoside phosphotransferase (APT) family kinase protein